MKNYFIFNDKDSRDFNLHLSEYPPETIPQERVEFSTVPGRSGTLHIREGESVYDSYSVALTITALDESRIPEIKKWLRGPGTIKFGNDLDYYREVYISGQTDFVRIFRQWKQAVVVFEFQPFKQLVKKQEFTIRGTANSSISVKTAINTPFKALLQITHPPTNSVSLLINETSFSIADVENTLITIDTEKQTVFDHNNNNLLNKCSFYAFPHLKQGNNRISQNGISSIHITTRGRFL